VSGGWTASGEAACDMWSMNLDKIVSYVETPQEASFENIWTRLDLDDPTIFCRWGHATGLVNARYMFVYGGVNLENYIVRDSFLFDMVEYYVIEMTEKGEIPPYRLMYSNLLEAGNGMMTLYGGEDADWKGHFTDIWHLRIHAYNVSENEKAHVDYKWVNYEKEGDGHQILSWWKGFTLHYLKS